MSDKSMIESLMPSRYETVDVEQTKQALFAYELPSLEERTLQDGLFRCYESYREAFTELKKFLWLCERTDEGYIMVSTLVDELWHQFILFTIEYHDFCDTFFGHYMHHNPKVFTASMPEVNPNVLKFFRSYKENFGPVSHLWLNSPTEKNGFLTFVDSQAWTPGDINHFSQ